MRQTVAVNLTFSATTSTAQGFIQVPFPVGEMKFRAILYNAAVNTPKYVYIRSDLCLNQPLGAAYLSNASPLFTDLGLTFRPDAALPLNNYYLFTLYNTDGSISLGTGADTCTIIIEMISNDDQP